MSRKNLIFMLRWSLVAVLAFFLISYLADQWNQLDLKLTPQGVGVLGASFLFYTVGMALLPLPSWWMQRWLGYSLTPLLVWRSFYLAQFTKYLPGGIWSIPGRAVMYHRGGVPALDSGALVVLEMVGMLAGAGLVGVVSLPTFLPLIGEYIPAAVLIGAVGGVLLATLLWWFRRRWLPALQRLPLNGLLRVWACYAAIWVVFGVAFAITAPALGVGLSANEALQAVGVHAVGWAVGFVVIFTPGGIGVRDVILAFGLAPFMPMPFPVIISVLARIGWTLAEVIGFFAVVPLVRRWGGQGEQRSETHHPDTVL